MPIKRYNGTSWDVVAGAGAAGAPGTAPLTTKGDLLGFDTAANRVAVGTNGQTLVADSTATAGIRWQDAFTAGKNKIINGDFGVWQRGISGFTFGGSYNADRFAYYGDGTGVTRAITQQTFTPGTAPVSGYEGTYYFRYAQTVAGTGGAYNRLYQKIEDVRTFAGQTATLSFWAKADTTRLVTAAISQNFGTGGSSAVATSFSGSASLTTSWQRFSFTLAIPSITGKTVGTSSYLEVDIDFPLNTTQTIDIWGVQLEVGSVATPFTTATGTIQGELAACQRYFYSAGGDTAYDYFGTGFAWSASYLELYVTHPVKMRVAPTLSVAGTFQYYGGGGTGTVTLNATQYPSTLGSNIEFAATGLNAGQGYMTRANNNTATRLNWSAEL